MVWAKARDFVVKVRAYFITLVCAAGDRGKGQVVLCLRSPKFSLHVAYVYL
jgi:hypothetical protein